MPYYFSPETRRSRPPVISKPSSQINKSPLKVFSQESCPFIKIVFGSLNHALRFTGVSDTTPTIHATARSVGDGWFKPQAIHGRPNLSGQSTNESSLVICPARLAFRHVEAPPDHTHISRMVTICLRARLPNHTVSYQAFCRLSLGISRLPKYTAVSSRMQKSARPILHGARDNTENLPIERHARQQVAGTEMAVSSCATESLLVFESGRHYLCGCHWPGS